MAHEIVKMFAVGQKTWHGLETLLDTPPLTVDEVLHYSGMGLKVEKVPAKVFINGTLHGKPRRKF